MNRMLINQMFTNRLPKGSAIVGLVPALVITLMLAGNVLALPQVGNTLNSGNCGGSLKGRHGQWRPFAGGR